MINLEGKNILITGGAKLITGGFINLFHHLLNMRTRDPNGTFKRTIQKWSLENFNEGYIDNKGRFRVWLPTHPRSYENGWVLRSIVAFESYHNIKVPSTMDIHHLNEDRLDDSKDNLIMMTHGAHTNLHNQKKIKASDIIKTCENCGKPFIIKRWRLNQAVNEHIQRGRFCSQKCFHAYPRSKTHKKNISKGLKKAYNQKKR